MRWERQGLEQGTGGETGDLVPGARAGTEKVGNDDRCQNAYDFICSKILVDSKRHIYHINSSYLGS